VKGRVIVLVVGLVVVLCVVENVVVVFVGFGAVVDEVVAVNLIIS